MTYHLSSTTAKYTQRRLKKDLYELPRLLRKTMLPDEKKLALLSGGSYIVLMVVMGLSNTHLFGKTNAEVYTRGQTPDLNIRRLMNISTRRSNVAHMHSLHPETIGLYIPGQVSRLYPTPLTPAGYAFSIWGIIFLLQGAWVTGTAVQIFAGDGATSSILNSAGVPTVPVWYAAH